MPKKIRRELDPMTEVIINTVAQCTAARDHRIAKLEGALETLVEMYVANRGHRTNEFIACITPGSRPVDRRKSPCWKAWDNARRALGEIR